MNTTKFIYTPLACLAGLFLVHAIHVSAYAAIPPLVDSTFTGLTNDTSGQSSPALNGAGWYFWNIHAAGHAWQISSSTSTPLSGGVLKNQGSSAQGTVAVTQWQSVSLTNVGDSISVTFDLKTSNASAATDRPFSISLVNSPATMNDNVFGNKNYFSGASGYAFTQVFNTANGNYSTVSNSSADGLTWTSTGNEFTTLPIINNGVVHSYAFTLTRVDSGIEISLKIDGAPYTSYIDTSTATDSFNTLVLQAYADWQVGTMFDNIKVEYSSIPESKALSLVVGGVVLIGAIFLSGKNRGKSAFSPPLHTDSHSASGL